MAYCRMDGKCGVYMYHTVGGYQFHLALHINGGSDFLIEKAADALHRLRRLKTQGYGVPQSAIDRLAKEVGTPVSNKRITDK